MARKRSETCRVAILDAAAEVMEERGYLHLTVEEVAHRAHAGKQTIYRHWGGKPRLALEVWIRKAEAISVPDTGTLQGDLEADLAQLRAALSHPHKKPMLAGLLAEMQSDAELAADFRDRFVRVRRRSLSTAFQRAISRREIPADADVDLLLDLLLGPLWYRFLVSGMPLDAAFAEELVTAVVAAARVSHIVLAERQAV